MQNQKSETMDFKQAFLSLSLDEFKHFLNTQAYSTQTLEYYLEQTNTYAFLDDNELKNAESKQFIIINLINSIEENINTNNKQRKLSLS